MSVFIDGYEYRNVAIVRDWLEAKSSVDSVRVADFVITRSGLVLKNRHGGTYYYDTDALEAIREAQGI